MLCVFTLWRWSLPRQDLATAFRLDPFRVVEDDVTIGDECILESHVVIKSGTTLGEKNHLFEGAVVGGIPQHTNVPERLGRVIIGSGNTIRENVTIHKAMQPDHDTVIGDHCLLMCNAHVAHDCRLGDHVILTNNVMLAGHVTVGSRAFLSGGAGVHQFCRVGTLAMVGGLAHISRDVPPFVTIDGQSSYVVGLNQVGLKRAGYECEVDCAVEGGLSGDLPQRPDVEGDPRRAAGAIPRRGWPPSSCPSWRRPSGASFPSGGCRRAPPSASTRKTKKEREAAGPGGVGAWVPFEELPALRYDGSIRIRKRCFREI